MRRALVVSAVAVVAMLAVAASPAAATFIQDENGQPYTGVWSGSLAGNAVFSSSQGSVTCTRSSPRGQITNAGSTGNPATGSISSIDWDTSISDETCSTAIFGATHKDFVALSLPWNGSAEWLSDNTSGTPNGTFTFSDMGLRADFDAGAFGTPTCNYAGNFNNTGGTTPTQQIQVDLYNPDNTTSGETEMRFVSEPLQLTTGDDLCADDATLTATYTIGGLGGVNLQIREPTGQPPIGQPPGTSPPDTFPPDTAITAGPKDKTKKKTASFEFKAQPSETGATFACKLDSGAFEACTSPEDVSVKKGSHTFLVRARDAAGNVDPTPATQTWKVKKKRKK